MVWHATNSDRAEAQLQPVEVAEATQLWLCCYRPLDAQERAAKSAQVVSCNDERREVTVHHNVAGKQIGSTFKFDRVRLPSALSLMCSSLGPPTSQLH